MDVDISRSKTQRYQPPKKRMFHPYKKNLDGGNLTILDINKV